MRRTQNMKKILILSLILAASGFSAFAGDVAVFDDIGFSADGKYYVFGQYGKTDKKFVPYSEIYTVDVAKNDFVPGKVYKLSAKSNKGGKEIHQENTAKNYTAMKGLGCKPADAENILYINDEISKDSGISITFKSFEESTENKDWIYNVKVVPEYSGNKSSFYIDVKIKDQDGNVIKSYKTGNPSIKRKNVTNYRIIRIFTDKSRKSVVFVVEKTIEDQAGTSIRYMVETIKL